MSFFSELKERRVFRAAAVYAVTGWLLVNVAQVVEDAFVDYGFPPWFDMLVIVLLAIGFPVVLIMSWAFDITPDGIKPSKRRVEHVPTSRRSGLGDVVQVLVVAAVAFLLVDQYLLEDLADSPAGTAGSPALVKQFEIIPEQWRPEAFAEPGARRMIGMSSIDIAPDDSSIVFSAPTGIFHWNLATRATRSVVDGIIGGSPRFTPDSESVVYMDFDAAIRRASVVAQADVLVGESSGTRYLYGGSVTHDGRFLRVRDRNRSGTAVDTIIAYSLTSDDVTEILVSNPDERFRDPVLLPDGEHILLTVIPPGESLDVTNIEIRALNGDYRNVLSRGFGARYAPTASGHIVFMRHYEGLFAVPFDLESLQITGAVQSVMPGADHPCAETCSPNYAFSDYGTLVHVEDLSSRGRWYVWADRDSGEIDELLHESPINYPRIDNGGGRAAFVDRSGGDIWIYDFGTRALDLLTDDSDGRTNYPVWSGDDRIVAYRSERSIRLRRPVTADEATVIVDGVDGISPYFFTPGDDAIVFGGRSEASGEFGLGRVRLDGSGSVEWIIDEPGDQRNAELSPNGRYVAVQSNRSGGNQIEVRSWPDLEQRRVIDSGEQPLWSPLGDELFYIKTIDGEPRIVAVGVDTSGSEFFFDSDSTRVAVDYLAPRGPSGRNYDVSADGRRFFITVFNDPDVVPEPRIVVTTNWFSELERLVPAQ